MPKPTFGCFSVTAFILCLAGSHGDTRDSCEDDLHSLVQKGAVVTKRSVADGNAHAIPLEPDVNARKTSAIDHATDSVPKIGAFENNLTNALAVATADVLELPSMSLLGRSDLVPEFPGYSRGKKWRQDTIKKWNAFNTQTAEDVLIVCVCSIVVIALGWGAFLIKTRDGTERPTLKLSLLIASCGVCSWAMHIVNKALVTYLGKPTLVAAAQMFMAALAIVLLARERISGDWMEMLKWSLIPLFFFSMLVTSHFSYQYLTLSGLMLCRNLGPLITLPIESLVMPAEKRPSVTLQMVMALLLTLAAGFVYAAKTQVSGRGLSFAFVNMVLAVADRVAQRRLLTSECENLPTETCMFLNNVIGLVPTVALAAYWGNFDDLDLNKWFLSSSTVLLVLSGIINAGICYFAIAVQREISATAFMVLQNATRIAAVLIGVVIFYDPLGWPYQVAGLSMSFVGALWYGKAHIDGAWEARLQEVAKKELPLSEETLETQNVTKEVKT